MVGELIQPVSRLDEWELPREGELTPASSPILQSSIPSQTHRSLVEVDLLPPGSFPLLYSLLRGDYSFCRLLSTVQDSPSRPPLVVGIIYDVEDVSVVKPH